MKSLFLLYIKKSKNFCNILKYAVLKSSNRFKMSNSKTFKEEIDFIYNIKKENYNKYIEENKN